jgi:hypothetical protein
LWLLLRLETPLAAIGRGDRAPSWVVILAAIQRPLDVAAYGWGVDIVQQI